MGVNIIDVGLKFRQPLQNRTKTDYIVLHHAEASSATIEQIHQWHLANGWSGVGYNYYVRKDGSIYRGRPRDAIGAHCQGHNSDSIGICAEGDYMRETMPEAQKQSIIALCIELLSIYPNVKIVGHRDLYPTQCPGNNYPFNDIVNAVTHPIQMVAGLPFEDVYGHWAVNDIRDMFDRHLISTDKYFRPNDSMQRAEAVVMLNRIIHYIKGSIQTPQKQVTYEDIIPGYWAYNDIVEVFKLGLLSPETAFRPADPITRAEFSALLERLLGFLGVKLNSVAIPFTDMQGHWACEVVSKLYSINLISEDKFFRPNDSITRAEAITLFNRVLKYLGK
jgi:hypothetical protein